MQALPIVPPPAADEILSSWVARVAAAHHLRPTDLLCWIGAQYKNHRDLDLTIDNLSATRLAKAFRTSPEHIVSMTHTDLPTRARPFARAGHRIYACSFCFQNNSDRQNSPVLKSWTLWWERNCTTCGRTLAADDLSQAFPELPRRVYRRIDCWANEGATVLQKWAIENRCLDTSIEMSSFLKLTLRLGSVPVGGRIVRLAQPDIQITCSELPEGAHIAVFLR